MDFSIMFWGDAPNPHIRALSYQDILKLVQYADEHGFAGVWFPERHFHPWGGLHPNPSVLAAAAATVTKKIRLRAGSVVLPLHNPIRVAEEWSVVDNLSGGRVELAIASGWNYNDFVLAPGNYRKRKEDLWQWIATVRKLWRGETVAGENGVGLSAEVSTYPRPRQADLPLWITSSGALRTVCLAGEAGYDVFTHLLGQNYDAVAQKIAQYKAYRARGGHHEPGKISLMVHTYIGTDVAAVKNTVKEPMLSYLMNSADLIVTQEKREDWDKLDIAKKREMAELSFDRYFETSSLMGSRESCRGTLKHLIEIGVTDVCCLIDFGLPAEAIFESMQHLVELKKWCASVYPASRGTGTWS